MDQLNLGSLASLETLCRRVATIVEAYVVPSRPSWEHARHYAGTPAAEEVIAPSLRNFVHKRAKEENDLMAGRTRTVPRGPPRDDDTPAAGGGKGADGGKGRGGGRRRGAGRGLDSREQQSPAASP